MNILLTLFGGAGLIAVLYFLLGLLRLPHYWRAVVSGGALLLTYFAFAARDWPGLDVVAMHGVVFIATAVILSLRGSHPGTAAKKMHWAPKVLIIFFAILFVIDGIFIYVATHGLPDSVAQQLMPGAEKGGAHTSFPGVMPHGEDAAKPVNAHLKEQAEQQRKP